MGDPGGEGVGWVMDSALFVGPVEERNGCGSEGRLGQSACVGGSLIDRGERYDPSQRRLRMKGLVARGRIEDHERTR